MLAQLSRVAREGLGAHRLVVGGGGVEVGVEGHLGVDHHLAPADQVHHQVGAPGAVVEPHLLGEVAPVHQPGELDRTPEVELAPAATHLRTPERGRERPRLALERVDLLVEPALPRRALLVERLHLVAEPVEALHHLGLVDHALGVGRPRARPEQSEASAQDQAQRRGPRGS